MNIMIGIRTIFILASFLIISLRLSAKDFNIISYGAKSDTTILSTKAIQAAIDECGPGNGGKVIFPAGTYLTGTLYFKSNVTLHPDQWAT